jgi:hypothetical protein
MIVPKLQRERTTMTSQIQTLADATTGLKFTESPRWHNGKLWFLDIHDKRIKTVDLTGSVATVLDLPFLPNGFGLTPRGAIVVGDAFQRRIYRSAGASLQQVADISALTTFCLSDGIVDAKGRLYVGDIGYNFVDPAAKPVETCVIVLVGRSPRSTPARRRPRHLPGQGPEGRSERRHRADRRHGLRPVQRFRRAGQHADGRKAREERAEVQPVPHHGPLRADPNGPADRPQPPLVQHGIDHGDGNRLPRSDGRATAEHRPSGRDASLNGYSTAQFGKNHETPPWEISPSGPFDRWPTRSGFDKFYGFMGGETNQYYPAFTTVSPRSNAERPELPLHDRHDQPGHRLDAVSESPHTRTSRSSSTTPRAPRTRRTRPRRSTSTSTRASSITAGTSSARSPSRTRRNWGGAAGHETGSQARGDQGLGQTDGRREEAVRPADGGVRRVRRAHRPRGRPPRGGDRGMGEMDNTLFIYIWATTARAPKGAWSGCSTK